MNPRQLAKSRLSDHDKLLSCLVNYDDQARRRGRNYNRFAFGLYMQALGAFDGAVAEGLPRREAVLRSFCGSLADRLLRSLGEPIRTPEEAHR